MYIARYRKRVREAFPASPKINDFRGERDFKSGFKLNRRALRSFFLGSAAT
jgi:hypothetical protein